VHPGIAADHGGFGLKEDLRSRLTAAGHHVIDFAAHRLEPGDYPDSLLLWRGQRRPVRYSAGLRFVEAVWVLPSVPTKFREFALL
jgi:hypothetical protein